MTKLPRVSPWMLARTFNQIALESFGGGLSAWSREVIVVERHWMTDEEFLSVSTICRILPGANQVNLAVFVGTRFAGGLGAAAALAGLLAIPGGLTLLAGSLYLRFGGLPSVRHTLSGMAAAAAGLTLSVAWSQGRKTLTSWVPAALGAATFAAAGVLRWPLWLTMLLLGPAGFLWAWRYRSDPA